MSRQGIGECAAVTVVRGHCSHHPRPFEVYRGRLIVYGCGDLINGYEGIDGNEPSRADLSLMYFVTLQPIAGEFLGLRMAPMRMPRFRLHRTGDDDVQWPARVLDREMKFGFGTLIRAGADQWLHAEW